jgi:hypothetical protein
MKITYVDHALERMEERHISKNDVEVTISSPDSTAPAHKGRTKFTKVVDDQQSPVRVVAQVKRLTADHYIVYTVY